MPDEFFATDDTTFDEAAAEGFTYLTIGAVRRAIDSGDITLNGERATRSARVVPGDIIIYEGDDADSGDPDSDIDDDSTSHVTDVPAAILYEDDSLIIIDKPAGVAVVPERGAQDWPLMRMLRDHARECEICGGAARFRVVHRLDRDTSGVLVLAKSLDAGRQLSQLFATHEVKKTYLAIVRGSPRDESGTIDAPIGASGKRKPLMAVVEGGKPSVTDWKVVERFRDFALVEASPRTGRTHQIRVHFAYAGMPLAVDEMYSGKAELHLSEFKRIYKPNRGMRPIIMRLTLHACGIEMRHPAHDRTVRATAPLPEDMARTMKMLRKHDK